MKLKFFLSIFHTFKAYGFDAFVFIAGLAGGIALLTKSTTLTRFQQFTTVLSGGFAANYLTPLVAKWVGMDGDSIYGIAFLVGYGGLKFVETLYQYLQAKFSNTNNNE